jgi:hypothetical protein
MSTFTELLAAEGFMVGLIVLGVAGAMVAAVLCSQVVDSHPMLAELTLQAIKDAEIPAMPADVIPLLPKNDRERLKIQYDAAIY